MLRSCGVRVDGASNLRVPASSDGTSWALDTSHADVSVTVTARMPAWSEFSQKLASPLWMSPPP